VRAHLEQGLGHYNPQRDRAHALLRGYDPGVACLAFLARVLWHLGYPDQALKYSDEALTLAHDLSHPFSLSWALSWTAALYQLRREVQEAREWAIGLNWHLNQNIKASVNYLHTDFKGGSKAKGEVTAQDEDAIFARVQFAF